MSGIRVWEVATPTKYITDINIFYVFLLSAVVLWYAYWRISRRHMLELLEKLPGPPTSVVTAVILKIIVSSHQSKI